MDKIPTPHVILCLSNGLEGHACDHFVARLPYGHLESALAPHPVNPLEIHLPAAVPEKAPREAVPPLRIALGHPTQGLGQSRIALRPLGLIPHP